MIRIAFLGLNPMGRRVLEWLVSLGENVVCVATEKTDLELVRRSNPDLIISAGFRHKVPPDVLALPKLGAINFHKSLLPLHRGANPVFWAMKEQTACGVSIHFMSEGLDEGAIIAQHQMSIDYAANARDVYALLDNEQVALFQRHWSDIRNGQVAPVEQGPGGSVHRIDDFKSLRRIDLSQQWTAGSFIAFLKAMTFPPFKNAYVELDGRQYFVEIKLTPTDPAADEPTAPGDLKQYS